jgi:peptide/nickel transport system permease protein
MNAMILRLILRRLLQAALTLLLVSAGVFFITNLLPGDAAQTALGQAATPETVAALRLQYGLDLPAPLRYAHWLGNLLSGNPGMSLVNNVPVAQMIGGRLPASLMLAVTALSVGAAGAVAGHRLGHVSRLLL